MSIEDSSQRELAKNSRKIAEHTTDIVDQLAKLAIAREDYRVGGQNEAWFVDPTYQIYTPGPTPGPMPGPIPGLSPLPNNPNNDSGSRRTGSNEPNGGGPNGGTGNTISNAKWSANETNNNPSNIDTTRIHLDNTPTKGKSTIIDALSEESDIKPISVDSRQSKVDSTKISFGTAPADSKAFVIDPSSGKININTFLPAEAEKIDVLPIPGKKPPTASLLKTNSGAPTANLAIGQLGKDGKISAINKASIGEGGAVSAQRLLAGAYTNNEFDFNTTGETIEDTARMSYQSSDYAQGTYQSRKVFTLIGAGVPTQWARSADTRSRLYNPNAEDVAVIQDILNRSSSTQGRVYITSATGRGYRADMNENMMLIDRALEERGINAESLTEKQIDKMIGGRGKHSYGNHQSHLHHGESRFFRGEIRDSMSGLKDTVFRRNTGWAGSADNGGIYVDNDVNALMMEKREYLQMLKKESPYQPPGGFEDRVGEKRMQGGLKGLGRAYIYESMDGSDMGEGYQTVRALQLGAKATQLVGIASSSSIKTLTLQGGTGVARLGSTIGKGLTNLGGNIYALGSSTRTARWQAHQSTINARFDAFNETAQTFARNKQKAINQKTRKKIEFVQTTPWQHAKNSARIAGRGARWAVGQIGQTRFGRALAPIVNVFARPVGIVNRWILRPVGNIFSAVNVWRKRVYENIANWMAQSTVFKILRAPFSVYNWFQDQLHKLLINAAIAAGGIIVVNVILLAAVYLIIVPFSFLMNDGGSTATISTMETAESEFSANLIDFYTNKLQVKVAELDCNNCTVISGYADCKVCNKTGTVPCATCFETGKKTITCLKCQGKVEIVKTCTKCQGTGQLINKAGMPNVYGTNSAIMGYAGCTDCGGSGSKTEYYNQYGLAHTDKNNFKKGTGTIIERCDKCPGTGNVTITCDKCLGTKKIECSKCSGDGSLSTTCTACDGRGYTEIYGSCTHQNANGGNVPHTISHSYKGAPTVSYSNLSSGTSSNTGFKYSDGTNLTYNRQHVYKAIISMGIIVSQGSEDDTLFKAYCENIMNKFLHTAQIQHPQGGSDGKIYISSTNCGLTDLMKLEGQTIKCTAPDCCGLIFPAINETWIKAKDKNLEWKGWRSNNNYEQALEWYETDLSEWKKEWGIELPSIMIN